MISLLTGLNDTNAGVKVGNYREGEGGAQRYETGAAAPHDASLFSRCYRRNVRTAGALVSPDTSRARTVIVYRPGPRKRCAASQLRV